jgi:hypothetical protein
MAATIGIQVMTSTSLLASIFVQFKTFVKNDIEQHNLHANLIVIS